MARHDSARYLSPDDSTTVVHTAAQEPLVLDQPMFRWDDADEVAAFVHAHPWATMVSAGGSQPHVVSHLPVLLDASGSGGLCVSSHLARADAEEHRLGVTDTVLILQGPHGYISPTFYGGGTHVPTWNFVVVHLHGRAEVLEPDETWDVLRRTVERFEDERQHPWSLGTVEGYARQIAPATTGFRLRPDRVVAKAKLNQNKPAAVVESVIAALGSDVTHGNAELAAAMRHHTGHRAMATTDQGREGPRADG